MAVAFLAPAALHAAPVLYTYDFDLTGSPYSGTGSFTVTSAVPGSGMVTYNGGTTLTALSFSIGGDIFSLAQDPSASVETLNGLIDTIQFGATDGTEVFSTSGGFAFSYQNAYYVTLMEPGTFTSFGAAPASVAPEPSSLILLGTGLAGIAGATRRRLLRS